MSMSLPVWPSWDLPWGGRRWRCCPRFSDQPQRWAVAPAAFMGVAGLASLSGSAAVHAVLSWVWPPVLFGLVVWMFVRVRRELRSRIAAGCCTRCSLCWRSPPWAAAMRPCGVAGRQGLSDARPAGRCGWVRVAPELHRFGQPDGRYGTGSGRSLLGLGWIAPAVARDSTVCVYDRPGRGWSDAADGPQDGDRIAADLHTLLDRAHVPGPYVLAGHSFGGLYVLRFAAMFPDQVAGLVLLDSTAPKPVRPCRPTASPTAFSLASPRIARGRPLRSRTPDRTVSYGSLPPCSRDEARANSSTARHLGSFIEEFVEANAAMQQARP